MRYIYMLNMDNEKFESCDVVVKFVTDSGGLFDGFTSIYSNKPLYSDDLAHLEEWVMQGEDQWEPQVDNWNQHNIKLKNHERIRKEPTGDNPKG
jgi:hypothetical protein